MKNLQLGVAGFFVCRGAGRKTGRIFAGSSRMRDVADFSVVPPAGRMKSPVCKYVGTCRPPGSRIFPLKGAMRRQRMPGTCFARAAKRAVQPRGLAPNPVPDA